MKTKKIIEKKTGEKYPSKTAKMTHEKKEGKKDTFLYGFFGKHFFK